MNTQQTTFAEYLQTAQSMDEFEAVRVGRQVFELTRNEALAMYTNHIAGTPNTLRPDARPAVSSEQ